MAISPSTQALLERQGLLRGEKQVDRAGLGRRAAYELLRNPVADYDAAEVQEKARIVAELEASIFGTINDETAQQEIFELLRSVLGAEGHAQKLLEELHEIERMRSENGDAEKMVLLSTAVDRTMSNGDAPKTKVRARGYFVTANADLIEELMWDRSAGRVISGVRTLNRQVAFTTERVPALGDRQVAFYGELQSRLDSEMPQLEAGQLEEGEGE